MKLLELEILNVRGIPYLLLEPGDKNLVIWGPNGSGKSSVVDAIDFLLTGRISRLAGKGTGNIKLKDHGPHIDHKPEEAEVKAKIMLPGIAESVEIRRCMDNPGTLECDPSVAPRLKQLEILARRGQHVLTRREILKFITADGGTRAKQIQELLNITEVEKNRLALGRVLNKLADAYKATKHTRDATRSHINANVQAKTYSDEAVLEVVNQNRAILKRQPISSLEASSTASRLE